MSTSEEETTTPEVSDETSGESGADSSNVESSADDPSSPSNEGSSPSTSGNDTPPKKERTKRKSRHLRAHRRGKKSRRSRKSTDEITTDGTDTPKSTDGTPDKSSTEEQEQDSPAPESSGDESPAADPNWTMSEDVILVNMKKDDRKPSWTEIAQAMHKSKKDIKARWKILRDKTEQQPRSQEEEEEEDPSEPEVEQQQQPERKTKKSRKRRGKRASKHKPSTQAEETIVLSGEDASAEASPDDGPADQKSPSSSSEADSLTYAGSDREIRRQKRYLQRHIRAKLFPPNKYPTADETFSQEDCEILASVESQYKISKCLEMQANFYNVTGRLVPIELIRARCEKEEGTH